MAARKRLGMSEGDAIMRDDSISCETLTWTLGGLGAFGGTLIGTAMGSIVHSTLRFFLETSISPSI
jgi:hypothetical protein